VTITSTSKKYDRPPIVEVVCGVHFDEISGLDPVLIGSFWKTLANRFPQRELRPAVQEPGKGGDQFVIGLLPQLRALLLSGDGSTILQVQRDRFYFNWRRDNFDAPYPRFSDHAGKQGVGTIAIEEFGRFVEFCQHEIGVSPILKKIELAKVDLLVEGKHWSDFKDLTRVLPWLASYGSFSKAKDPTFSLHFEEQREAGPLTVSIGIAPTLGSISNKRVVKIEARLVTSVSDADDLPDAFTILNSELNEVFQDLIPESERETRFMKGGVDV
jgi:hypothetical protein